MNERGAVILGSGTDERRPAQLLLGFDIEARFDVMTQHLCDFERSVMDHLLWETHQPRPVYHRGVGTVTTSSSGFGVVDCGGPSQGHVWQVLGVTVGGLATSTTTSGRVDMFVSKTDYRIFSSAAQPGTSDWRDFTLSIPNVAFYHPGQILLHPQEHLFLVLSGATADFVFVAAASIMDDREDSVMLVAL